MGTCTYTLSKVCDSEVQPHFNVEAANEHRGGNTKVSYVRSVTVAVHGHRITIEKDRWVKVDEIFVVLPVTLSPGINIFLSGNNVLVTTDFGLTVKFDGNHRVEVTVPGQYADKVCGICGNFNGDATDDFLNPNKELEANSADLGNSWEVVNVSSCSPGIQNTTNCTDDEEYTITSNSFCGIITDFNGPFKKCHAVIDPFVYFYTCAYDLCELDMDLESLCNSLQSYAEACQSHGIIIHPWRNESFCSQQCPPNSHYEHCGTACPATCVNKNSPSTCKLPCTEGCICNPGYVLYDRTCVPVHECGCWDGDKHYPVGSAFWTDDTCSTYCRCPSVGSALICSSASCQPDFHCGISDGVPGCYEMTYGICNINGDPHYSTFDKKLYDFQGMCTYTVSKLCDNSTSSLPYFNVETKNQHRGNPALSWVQKVIVDAYNHRITILQGQHNRILVNDVWVSLPVSLVGGSLTIKRSGGYIQAETDFNLTVSYDANHDLWVKVPTTYFNQTCAMCGNLNGNKSDDFMMPTGQQAQHATQFGNSWIVNYEDDLTCTEAPPPVVCPPEKEEMYGSNAYCGIITSHDGPFRACHSVINPDRYLTACIFDVCAVGDNVLCSLLQSYGSACLAVGVSIAWRNSTFCPLNCPANSHYNSCSSGCPATCHSQKGPENCNKPCIEDCVCENGFVLSGSDCVATSDCGCFYNNIYYEKGETFWREGCQGQCTCAGPNVYCNNNQCGSNEVCKVHRGVLGCYQAGSSICHIYGDPHYFTFDGKLYHFQGSCTYTTVETCMDSSVNFSITTRNEHRGSLTWTALNSIDIRIGDLHVTLGKNKTVFVNGLLVILPEHSIPGISIQFSGSYVVLQAGFDLEVKFSGDHELFVKVSEKFKGQLCGLCGNYNGIGSDDFQKPDGSQAQTSNEFGNSWRIPDDDWVCDENVIDPLPCNPTDKRHYEELCKILLEAPFRNCHYYLPAQLYFESCVYDQCGTGGNREQFCNSLESYAAACESIGVYLGNWKKDTVCALTTTTTTTTRTTMATTSTTIPQGSCVVYGDPHYYTFDKQVHHFMGTCTYTLSKVCENGTQPHFNVEAANEHRGGNTKVSYVKFVRVVVHGHRILMEKDKWVKVDEIFVVLPVTLTPGINIFLSGSNVVVTTDFGLTVKFDGNHRVEVTVPGQYADKVCGICGNFNGDATDDFLNPNEELEANSADLGNSWQVVNDSSCFPGIENTPDCTDEEDYTIASNSFCGIITDINGPFRDCHTIIDPVAYFYACVYDLCELDMDLASLCNSLHAYSEACHPYGITIHPWRNESFCPLQCPANSHYEQCGTACPATCVNPASPSTCKFPCAEGCICNKGYVLYDKACVPVNQCGCWYGGKHYPVGSESWTDDTCSTNCRCLSAGSALTCNSASCPPDKHCGITDGVPGCYGLTFGKCEVGGDPHYYTFDKSSFHFQGMCTYTLSKLCGNSTSFLPYFNVEGKNMHQGRPSFSSLQKVIVDAYNHRITIVRGESGHVLVNDVWVSLPISLANGSLTVQRSGRFVQTETDFKLTVAYDTNQFLVVKLPTTFSNQICGMCGNLNGDRRDDFMKPNGQQAQNANQFGDSWMVDYDNDLTCTPVPTPEVCSKEKEEMYESNAYCGIITSRDGPFQACHSLINPQRFLSACVFDLCAVGVGALCPSLEAYGSACHMEGLPISWRTSTFCPLRCPANSHYKLCSTACPPTCLDLSAPINCSKPCMEDCECNEGFVLGGSSCVPISNCGCLYNNLYYERGSTFWRGECEGQCTCIEHNRVDCNNNQCGTNEVCKVHRGVLGCHPEETSICHIYGDPHYFTFDGKLYHFQGSCTYTTVETCSNSSVNFSVTTRNEHRGSLAWTALNSVDIRIGDLHVTLGKNKTVYVSIITNMTN
uniref:VWFD domain-containing protein n=1 Tax=Leptobrachium leishanense TaxID=445787 RepID=A0A8C5WH93_9ANUR